MSKKRKGSAPPPPPEPEPELQHDKGEEAPADLDPSLEPSNLGSQAELLAVRLRSMVPTNADLSYILPELRPFAVPLEVLVPDPMNANSHDDTSILVISGSHQLYEQHRLLVVNLRTGSPVVIIGNGALEACKKLGWKYIAVTFVDEDHVKAAGRAIADNRTAHFSNFNTEVLAPLLDGLRKEGVPTEKFGAGDEYLQELLKQLQSGTGEIEVPDGDPQEDPKDKVISIVVEIHVPPELSDQVVPALKAAVTPFEKAGVTLNIA